MWDISIEWQDGLPLYELEAAQMEPLKSTIAIVIPNERFAKNIFASIHEFEFNFFI